MRGVTGWSGHWYKRDRFQSTLPMRGVTDKNMKQFRDKVISIHTPHAGSDLVLLFFTHIKECISIHTPHAGSDDDPPNR